MKSSFFQNKIFFIASLFACSILKLQATTVTQYPIFLSTGAEPNLMFIIDDSSSMISEMMPEKFQQSGLPAYVFPPSVTQYGVKPTGVSSVVTLNPSHAFHRLVRSKVNTIYYDPAKLYLPWVAPDGSAMANANEECAFHNPVKTDANATLRILGVDTGEVHCRNLVQDHVASGFYAGNTDTDYNPENCTGINAAGTQATGCGTTQTFQKVTRGASAPGSSVNGDVYIDNSNVMYVRYNNAWRKLTLGVAEPASTAANEIWVDLSGETSVTKQRNSTNTAWTTINLSILSYYPATYYNFIGDVSNTSTSGTGVFNASNYSKVEIRPGNTYTDDGRNSTTRPDCAADDSGVWTCTYEQEIQNFANWYTYYRSRALLARGAIGSAFSNLGEGIRVGYGAINKKPATLDGVANTQAIVKNVSKFTTAVKTDFLKELYKGRIPYATDTDNGTTPLRTALASAGKFYSREDAKGPWSSEPGTGTDATATFASCRRSYTILTTDGYWNHRSPLRYGQDLFSGDTAGDADGTEGSVIENHGANSATYPNYKYTPVFPFKDNLAGNSNTLADIAMKYWKTDLAPNIPNRINAAPDDVDNAFWQHMTTYTVAIGVEGAVVSYPFNGQYTVPDIIRDPSLLPTGFTWGNYNYSTDPDSSGRPEKIDDLIHAAVNGRGGFFSAHNPEQLKTELGNMLEDIMGRQKGNAAAAAANSTNLSTESLLFKAQFDSGNWTGTLQAVKIGPDGLVEKTTNATGQVVDAVLWTSSVPAVQSRKIFSISGSTGIALNWDNLSAAQKLIFQNGGSENDGKNLLDWFKGKNDIPGLRVRTSLIGDIVNSDPAYAGSENYRYEKLNADLGGTSYQAFYSSSKVSIDPESGARTERTPMIYVGANDGMLHAFNATTGVEVFAYAPSSIFSGIPALANLNYKNQHRYYVDGPVYINDAYVDGEWRTILVGTLGAGGRSLFVLDITDPENFSAEDVLFELSEADYPELGNMLGAAIIAPGNDNRWKIFVGNGYNSSQGAVENAYLGIIDIDDEYKNTSPSRTKFIQASTAVNNGLAQPALLPDPSGKIVAAFAGDLLGNMWKFDLSAENPASWSLAYSNRPLFTAKDPDGDPQAITSSPTLGFNIHKSPAALMVYFGTGKYFELADIGDSQTQSFYGIVDKEYADVLTRENIFEKTFEDLSARKLDAEVVDWEAFDGWYLDFTGGDRVISKPILVSGNLIFPTLIPSDDPCESGGSGWLMELKGVGDKDCLLCDAVPLAEPIIGDLILLEGFSASKNLLNVFVGANTEGELMSEVTEDENAGLGRHYWRQLR